MSTKKKLIEEIISGGCYKEGRFLLSSGKESNFYIDMRPCMLSTKKIHLITTCFIEKLCHGKGLLEKDDLLCGVITSGLFLTGVMIQRLSTSYLDTSAIYCRTEHRMHGALRDIEGTYKPGQSIIIIDDVATSGKSLMKIIDIAVKHSLPVKAALVIVDRQEGAKELLAACDVPLISCVTLEEIKNANARTSH